MARVVRDCSLQANGPEGAMEGAKAPVASVPLIRARFPFVRVPVLVVCSEAEDRTQQAFKDECDINFLMKRFEKTGILPQGRSVPPQYLDATLFDFTEAQNRVAQVRGVFSMLDARTRARFENDPANMLDFLANPENHAEAIKMGLMAKPKGVRDGSDEAVAGAGSVGQAGKADQGDGAAGRAAASADQGSPGGAPAIGGAGGTEGGQGR